MMTKRVTSAVEAIEGIKQEDYWERTEHVYADVEKLADYNKPILMMARAIKDQFGDDLPKVVARWLYRGRNRFLMSKRHLGTGKRISSRSGIPEYELRLPSSELMRAIVALARAERDVKGVQAIINYNYDDLLDETLKQENVRCMTVRSGRDRVPAGTLPCYHVHGVLPVRQFAFRRDLLTKNYGNFVFSEDEYHAEYADPYRWSNMTQMSLLGRYTGLFVGLSMEDPNIRRLIDATHKQYPEIVNYAILPRRRDPKDSHKDSKQTILENLFEEVESVSFARIGVKVIWVDNHAAIDGVIRKICDFDGSTMTAQKPGISNKNKRKTTQASPGGGDG
jgi:hypothetical protein